MDIKLKSSKSKYIISTIILAVMIVVSLGMYSVYPIINQQASRHESNIFENSDFFYNLCNSNYGIYFDIIKSKENKNVEPSDVILDFDKKYDHNTMESMKENENIFNDRIYSYYSNLDTELKNLEYYAVKKDSNSVEERNSGEINLLMNSNINSSVIETLNKKYSFYIVIDYDDSGKSTIKKLYGADMSSVLQVLKNSDRQNINDLQLKPIKNMTYIYAVQKNLVYKDMLTSYKYNNEIDAYRHAGEPFVILAFGFIFILSFITPYKISKEFIGVKKLIKIPVEVICFAELAILMTVLRKYYFLIAHTSIGDLINLPNIGISVSLINVLVVTINILYWLLCFGAIYFGTFVLKHIFKTGIRQYIKDCSLVYNILRTISKGFKKIYKYCLDIDLKENNTKKLAVLLGINLLIMSLMCSIWFIGIITAIIYTLILFVVIKKRYRDIGSKYKKILEAISKIANGNLDTKIEEDLGIFNSLKKEIESIQNSIRKAVNEEVKSQRMKTELISNVSHDLKTPLTSIITYVDLLKDENLPEEKYREYLDILDRKTQRLHELIEDLFEVSKATSGNISLNLANVDVVALMKQTLLELDDKIEQASLIVKANYPEGKVVLPLDSQRIFRVFENLIINITKYSMPGSRVYIDITSNDNEVEIIIKNIAAEEIAFNVDDILERFVRGDKARTTEGSGLGLAIAKSFIELQGGKLSVNVDGDLFKVIITFSKFL